MVDYTPYIQLLNSSLFVILISLLVIGGGALIILSVYRKKHVWVDRVLIVSPRENNTLYINQSFYKGGVFKNNQGVAQYRIKTGRNFWNVIKLNYMPDRSKISANDVLVFVKTGDITTLQQCELVFSPVVEVIDGQEKKYYNLLVKPVPNDIKTATLINLRDTANVLKQTPISVTVTIFTAFIIMVIAFLVAYFLLMKSTGG